MTVDDVDTWFEKEFRDKYREHADKIGRFNLAIFGKTGVGKSTLINAVFGAEVAETGIGEPVTMDGHLYLSSADFLGIYDTRGIEIGRDSEALIQELNELVKEHRHKALHEQIHAVWYCISAPGARIELPEQDFIRRVHELDLPIVLVLTRAERYEDEPDQEHVALADYIAGLSLPIDQGPVLVAAKSRPGREMWGLEELLEATFRIVPDGVAAALDTAQRIDLARKRKRVATAITAAVASAAAIAAAPIPIAAAALLAPLQFGLVASVSAIYGIEADRATLAATVVPTIATGAGRAAVGSLLKLIPAAGLVIGGVINAGTAGLLTAAIGYAWAAVCEQLLKDESGLIDSAALRTLFNAEFVAQLSKLKVNAKSKGK